MLKSPTCDRHSAAALVIKVVLAIAASLCLWKAWSGMAVADAMSSRKAPAVQPQGPKDDGRRIHESGLVTREIRSIRPGMRVLADNPELDGEQIEDSDIASDWQLIELKMTKPEGGSIEVQLLRPKLWLVDQLAAVLEQQRHNSEFVRSINTARRTAKGLVADILIGRKITLDLPEMGADGEAEVIDIRNCPAIEAARSGQQRIVTGTFHHSSSTLLDLQLASQTAPIGVTGNHPIWSVDRDEFVPAERLSVGETLKLADQSTTTVTAITSRPCQPIDVYNLEVDVEHVYFVGDSGLLVHNSYGTKGSGPLHHLVSWYSNAKRGWKQNWTAKSKDILDNAGIGYHSGKNLVYLPGHTGPHPELYHQRVYERLRDAVTSLTAGTEAYSAAVVDELGAIATDLLNDIGKLQGIGL